MDLVEKIEILQNHLKSKNFKKVIDGSLKLINKTPNNDYLYNLIGMAYQGLSQHENSVKYFRMALDYRPNNLAAMNNYGNSLKALGKLEASQECFEEILKANPHYINAYNNYANLKTLVNDYEGAIALYKKAIQILKNNEKSPKTTIVNLLFSLAVAYQSENKIEEVKKIIQEVLSIDPTHAGCHKLISSITKYSNDDLISLEHLKKMEQLNSNIENSNYEKKVDLCYALAKANEDIKN